MSARSTIPDTGAPQALRGAIAATTTTHLEPEPNLAYAKSHESWGSAFPPGPHGSYAYETLCTKPMQILVDIRLPLLRVKTIIRVNLMYVLGGEG